MDTQGNAQGGDLHLFNLRDHHDFHSHRDINVWQRKNNRPDVFASLRYTKSTQLGQYPFDIEHAQLLEYA